jgi:magnesium chelatase accessory protein
MTSAAPDRVPPDWPHRAHSRAVRVGRLDWHVQVAGQGPTLLLLHGTGASAHSWAGLLPSLAEVATVVAPDLPGHGYTLGATPADLSLPRIAVALDGLLGTLALPAPALAVGHSAGAALALRWALGQPPPMRPRALLGFNPSLVAPPAFYTQWLAPLVNPVATSGPVAALLAAVGARSKMIDALLDSTGSTLPPAQRALYTRLFGRSEHVQGSMGFMAAADLPALLQEVRELRMPTTFVLGRADRWVPTAPLERAIAAALPDAKLLHWAGGHLLHEVETARAAALVRAQLRGDTVSA